MGKGIEQIYEGGQLSRGPSGGGREQEMPDLGLFTGEGF